jgi:hypothetical protein
VGFLLIKPQFLLLFPFVLAIVSDKWKFLKGFVLSVAVLVVVSLLVSGVDAPVNYFAFLKQTNSPDYGNRYWQMFTLYSLLKQTPYLSRLSFNWISVINLLFYFISFVVFINKSRRLPFDIVFSNALILTIVFSVHTLVHDTSMLFISFLIFIELLRRSNNYRSKVLLIFSSLVIYVIPIIRYTNLIYVSSVLFLLVLFVSTKAVVLARET